MDILHVRLLSKEDGKFLSEDKELQCWVHSSEVPLSQHQLLELHDHVGLVASAAGTVTWKSYHIEDKRESREKEGNWRLYMFIAWKLPCVY